MKKSLRQRVRLRVPLPSLAATSRLANSLARLAVAGDLIGLRGDLGAGKTTFARFFIKSLVSSVREIPSPTFPMVQSYQGMQVTLWHFDFYRLTSPEAVFELGWEEAIQGIVLMEWPERLGDLLPAEYLQLHFIHEPSRQALVYGSQHWAQRLRSIEQ